MVKGVLVDLTKCVGCGGCTVACKLWNDLKFDETKPTTGTGAKLSDINWTVVRLHETATEDGTPVWRFVKQQCLHCLEPACASACFSKAMQKTEEGPVVYYPHLCVGCRYCMVACPFDVPKYEWQKVFPLVTKCQLCSTKIARGEVPACVAVCPTGALKFGEREMLLREANSVIAADSKYVREIYGEKEVGGTSWLYISDIPFRQLGFKTNLGTTPLPTYAASFLKYTPLVAVGWGMILTGLYHYTKRREAVAKNDHKRTNDIKA